MLLGFGYLNQTLTINLATLGSCSGRMVEKSVKLSSKDTSPVKTISQALVCKLGARKLKVCGNEGALPSRQLDGDLGEDLSNISDAEVAGYLNNKKEFILNKIAWELMNPEYQKGTRRKVTIGKKKDPANRTAPSKKTSATGTESNAESENEKRPSLKINYDALDKLFDDNSSKRAKLEKALVVSDQMEYSKQSSEESLLQLKGSEDEEEEEEPDWNKDYSNEDEFRGDGECYGDEDLELEDQEDNEGVI